VVDATAREQVRAEIAHWRYATTSLRLLDDLASPSAWNQLEDYLRLRVRDRLLASVARLEVEGAALDALLDTAVQLEQVRERFLSFRRRYLEVESTVDFYSDAVRSRTTPGLGGVLRGLDTLGVDALELVLRPLGLEVPQVLVYPDRGAGASILRSGIPLWDGGGLSPVAAIKITWHNLSHPSALLHEVGHQVQGSTGWTAELSEALARALAAPAATGSAELAGLVAGWTSEIASDVVATHLAGWSPLPALAGVVDGPTATVHRIRTGDPHPPGYLRVLLGTALCRLWYGAGPWDCLARVWQDRHDPAGRSGEDAAVARAVAPHLVLIAELCSRQPYSALGGRPLAQLADPRVVSPGALEALARAAGPTLTTSSYLARHDSLRILALLTAQQPRDQAEMRAKSERLQHWLTSLAPMPQPRAA
jgi:hypothetical protein